MDDRIFLSYRVGDTDEYVKYWSQCIRDILGDESAYEYTYSNHPGEDFDKRLCLEVSRSEYLFAFIGKKWVKHVGANIDWVEREILDAVDAKLQIIPIFFDGAHPESLKESKLLRHFEMKHSVLVPLGEECDKDVVHNLLNKLGIERKHVIRTEIKRYVSFFISPDKFISALKNKPISMLSWMLGITSFSAIVALTILDYLLNGEILVVEEFLSFLINFIYISLLVGSAYTLLTLPTKKTIVLWPLLDRFLLGYVQFPMFIILAAVVSVYLPSIIFGLSDSKLYYGILFEEVRRYGYGFKAIGNWVNIINFDDSNFLKWVIVGQFATPIIYFSWQLKSIRVMRKIFRYTALTPFLLIFLTLLIVIAGYAFTYIDLYWKINGHSP